MAFYIARRPPIVVSGTAYTDSGTVSFTFALSGVDSAGNADAGTVSFTPALSGSDSTGAADTGTVHVTFALSGADSLGSADAGTLPFTFALTGSDNTGSSDAGTLPVSFTLTGSDSAGSVDAGTLPVSFALSGTDTYTPAGGTAYTDSGSLPVAFALAGSDSTGSADAGTVSFSPVLSGVDSAGSVDAGSIHVTPTLSGVDSAGSADAGALGFTFALSGVGTTGSADAGTLPVSFTLSGVDALGVADAGGIAVVFALAGSDTYTPVGSVSIIGVFYSSPFPGVLDDPQATSYLDTPAGGVGDNAEQTQAPELVTPLGYSNQALGGVVVADVETLIGRHFHGLRQNQDISVTGWTVAATEFTNGRVKTYRSIQISTGTWRDVANGLSDATLTTTFQNLMALSSQWNPLNPAIICFHHEATLAANDVFGNAQDYIDAWRHVVTLADSLGATVHSKTGAYVGGPIQFAYVGWNRMFTNGTVDSPPAGKSYSDYDPDLGSSPAPAGTTYYTFCGGDPYNDLQSAGVLKYGTAAATLLDGIRTQTIARGKDWIIGEIACADGATAQDHTNKAVWWDSVRAYIDAIPSDAASGVCRAMFATIKADANLYNVDSSAQSTAAWQRLGSDPYYA